MSDVFETRQEMLERFCAEVGYSVAEMVGRERTKHVVMARKHVARRLVESGLSSPEVGRLLGGRDHTTILHLCKTGGRTGARVKLRVVA